MSKPIVAIVRRPNVGKSILLNVVAGGTISIVKDTPGVTKDRICAGCTWLDMNFTLTDTGGTEPDTNDIILSQIREQAGVAIATAGVIIFIADVRQRLVDADFRVADVLRKSKKSMVLTVNKVGSFQKSSSDVYELYDLGLDDLITVSTASRLGIGNLLSKTAKYFDMEQVEDKGDEHPRITMVSKPNVGESFVINKLIGKDRMIVSSIAGITRDAVDTKMMHSGTEYVFIDTAGLRRKSKIKEELKQCSIIHAATAVERADIVVMVVDASEGVTEQDAKIAGITHERGEGVIIAVNKWGVVERNDKTVYEFTREVRDTLSFMQYAGIIFISALTGRRLNELFETIDMVRENQTLRVQAGVFNEIMIEAVALQQPPSDKGERLRLCYIVQVAVKPPTLVIFINDKGLMHFSYTRYLESRIRETFEFRGTSLKFIIRKRSGKESQFMGRIICLITRCTCGLLQTGYVYSRIHHIDIREKGSGNSGNTNVLRVMGVKAGTTVFFGDSLKTLIPYLVVRYLSRGQPDMRNLLVFYMALGVVLEHNYPFYMRFKGSKGIVVTAGLLVTMDLRMTAVCPILFVLIVAVIHYVSLGSLVVVTVFLAGMIFFDGREDYGIASQYLAEFYIVSVCVTGLMYWRHRANIVRLVYGNENKIGGKK